MLSLHLRLHLLLAKCRLVHQISRLQIVIIMGLMGWVDGLLLLLYVDVYIRLVLRRLNVLMNVLVILMNLVGIDVIIVRV